MSNQRFQQGQEVTWRDASGQRYRGRVVQYHPARVDTTTGAECDEEVLVIVDGTSHVSIVPPAALATDQARSTSRRPLL